MTKYVVLKRSIGDGWMPGDVLADPESADLLVTRGFIQEVPDDYVSRAEKAQTEADERGPSFQSLIDYGYSERAATALSSGRDPKYAQEERAKLEARDAFRATRPEAEDIALFLDEHASAVYDLSDEEYQEALKAMKEAKAEAEAAAAEGPPEGTLPNPQPAGSVGAATEPEGEGEGDLPEVVDLEAAAADGGEGDEPNPPVITVGTPG